MSQKIQKSIVLNPSGTPQEFFVQETSLYSVFVTDPGEHSFTFYIAEGVFFSFECKALQKKTGVMTISVSVIHKGGESHSRSSVRGVSQKGQIVYKAYSGITPGVQNTKSSQEGKFLLMGGSVSGAPSLGVSSLLNEAVHSFSSLPLSLFLVEYYLLKGFSEEEAREFLIDSFLQS
jgi:Fe-S cluster assembly scaffold protein SufB